MVRKVMGYGIAYSFKTSMDFAIGEAENSKAFLFQKPCAGRIILNILVQSVLATIQLDGELCLEADKVHEYGPRYRTAAFRPWTILAAISGVVRKRLGIDIRADAVRTALTSNGHSVAARALAQRRQPGCR